MGAGQLRVSAQSESPGAIPGSNSSTGTWAPSASSIIQVAEENKDDTMGQDQIQTLTEKYNLTFNLADLQAKPIKWYQLESPL